MQRLALIAILSACATTGDEAGLDEQEASGTEYVDILDFSGTDQDAWIGVRHELAREFDALCGDTFCGGDYANLTPLTFTCSVTSKLGKIKDCAWTFAGSLSAVHPTTAAMSIDAPRFECHIKPVTTAKRLVTLLAGQTDAIHMPLPGTTSIYDSLETCMQNPIGQTPVTFADPSTATYIHSADYYRLPSAYAKYRAARAALEDSFDQVCGDTFCSGDYSDLQSLDFACSVTKSTGNIKSCAWIFGGSYMLAGPALDIHSKTARCNVPVKGTLSQLITTLTAPGSQPAIRRVLPGTTASAYDALAGCI